MKVKCSRCGKPAVWLYMPGRNGTDDYCCDKHVPRGCSCNFSLKEGVDPDGALAEDDWVEDIDELGRKYPCCEWFYSQEGYSDEVD